MNGSIPKIILNAPDIISGMLIVGRKQDCSISSHFVPSRFNIFPSHMFERGQRVSDLSERGAV